MDALEMRSRGAEILSAICAQHGFAYEPGESGVGSGGLFARGSFVRSDRRLEFSVRYSLGEVVYRSGSTVISHEQYMRFIAGQGQYAYPGFSDDPLDGFRHLSSDLGRFGALFLSGTVAEFATVAKAAADVSSPKGFAGLDSLSPAS